MRLAILPLCASLLFGLARGCDFDQFSRAVKSLQILEPGDSHCLQGYVGETIDLVCTSVCGDLNWFVNGERVVTGINVDNATVTMSSRCYNEYNNCAYQSYIDCEKTYDDGRYLLSNFSIIPNTEENFLIECEALLCGEKLRKSAMLEAKDKLNTFKSLPIPSTTTLMTCPSNTDAMTPSTLMVVTCPTPSTTTLITCPSNTDAMTPSTSMVVTCPTNLATVTPLENTIYLGNSGSAVSGTPRPESVMITFCGCWLLFVLWKHFHLQYC